MSVTKTTGAEVYSVRNAGEWASIVVRCWQEHGQDGELRHRGELLINSTFGAWSNYWAAPGMPFKRFLVGLNFQYLMEKLMGRSLEEHDGEATLAGLQKRVLEMRRQSRIDKQAAAWLWREIDERHERLSGSVETFVDACADIESEAGQIWAVKHTASARRQIAELFAEPWYQTVDRTNPQAVGFWREIWPEFTAALKAEMAEQAVPA